MLWWLARFYGHPEEHRRKETWNLLDLLKPNIDQAWCVLSDFNEIISQGEKMGGRQRLEDQMEEFIEAWFENDLFYLGWV